MYIINCRQKFNSIYLSANQFWQLEIMCKLDRLFRSQQFDDMMRTYRDVWKEVVVEQLTFAQSVYLQQ